MHIWYSDITSIYLYASCFNHFSLQMKQRCQADQLTDMVGMKTAVDLWQLLPLATHY